MEPKQTGTLPLGVAPQGTILLVRSAAGSYSELILEGLNALFIPGEWVWTEDKIDGRTETVDCTQTIVVGNGAAIGDTTVGLIAIAAGEVWIISDFLITSNAAPAATGVSTYNVLVSSLPKTAAGTDSPLMEANRATPDATNEMIEIPTGYVRNAAWAIAAYIGALGTELRILGPATITLAMLTLTAFTATDTQTTTLDVMGRKVNKLVG